MLNSVGDRTLLLFTIMIVILTVLVIVCYGAIAVNPKVAFNPFPPPDTPTPVTPTSTPVVPATYPPTWTPSVTPTPSDTPPPRSTWTPTVTRTPTPTPTGTATNTPTATATRPTATATGTATATPPPPYSMLGFIATANTINHHGCNWFGVVGYVYRADGIPKQGITVKLWTTEGWNAPDVDTDGAGRYEIYIDNKPKVGNWNIQLYEGGSPVSETKSFGSSDSCTTNQININWRANS